MVLKVENIIVYSVLILAFIGLTTFYTYNFLPAISLIELLFFSTSLFFIKKLNKNIILYTSISFIYILYSFLVAYFFNNTNVLDFIQAYKAFIYVVMLSFVINKQIFSVNMIHKLLNILIFIFLIKYGYSRLLGFDDRPGVFTENNFELIFLLLIYHLSYILNNDKIKWLQFLAISIIFILSGSRSGIVALFFVFFMMTFSKFDWKFFLKFILLFFLAAAVLFIISQRLGSGGDVESIDRYKFLLMFLHDVSDWEWWRFLIGAEPLTPMSNYTCQNLSFYQSLFSYKNDGTCYSVILHSYILRVIYDHGFLGLIFLILFVWKAMKLKGYSFKQFFTVIGVIMITSLSVSAFNNVFVMLPLAFYFALKQREDIRHVRYSH